VVHDFVRAERLAEIHNDFPHVRGGGSFPLQSLKYGASFRQLTEELQSPEVRSIFAEKFDLDLSHRPATLTIRGQSRQKDGRIHTDSKSKLITVLLYLNGQWDSPGGRLRLLRSPDDIEDYFAEVPATGGTLVAFRCTDNAWHGHKPFVGVRRSIQLNWVVDDDAAKRSARRHGFSAFLKSLSPWRAAS
jgi:hypothetical protein